jgi:hypothetical protein
LDWINKLFWDPKNVQGDGVAAHKTSPLVLEGCGETKFFIGGATDFVALVHKVRNPYFMTFDEYLERKEICLSACNDI